MVDMHVIDDWLNIHFETIAASHSDMTQTEMQMENAFYFNVISFYSQFIDALHLYCRLELTLVTRWRCVSHNKIHNIVCGKDETTGGL